MVKELFNTLAARPDGVCNFIDASKWFEAGARIVYRQYATLYFIFAIDASESELGILDLIQARRLRPGCFSGAGLLGWVALARAQPATAVGAVARA